MASPKQNQVLRGLESGRKLLDLLREPGMPSKAMLDEWRDHPIFEEEFLQATEAGRVKRGDPANFRRLGRRVSPCTYPVPEEVKPAPLAVDEERVPLAKPAVLRGPRQTKYRAPAPEPAQPVVEELPPAPAPKPRRKPAAKPTKQSHATLVALAEQQLEQCLADVEVARATLAAARAQEGPGSLETT